MNPIHSIFGSDQNSEDHPQPVNAGTDGFWNTVVRCVFPLLVCASLSLGIQIPLFFDWSGAQQSHSPPIVGYVFAGFLIVCCVSLLVLPLFPKLKREDLIRNPLIQPFRPPLAVIITATMIVGLFFHRNAAVVVLGATFLYPVVCALNLGIVCRSLRWRIASLYSCLYLPFVWVLTNDVVQGALKQGSLEMSTLLIGAPALLWSLYIGRFCGQQHGMESSGVVIASLEALIGLFVIQVGARRAIGYLIVLLALSVTSSCLLLALLRA